MKKRKVYPLKANKRRLKAALRKAKPVRQTIRAVIVYSREQMVAITRDKSADLEAAQARTMARKLYYAGLELEGCQGANFVQGWCDAAAGRPKLDKSFLPQGHGEWTGDVDDDGDEIYEEVPDWYELSYLSGYNIRKGMTK